MSSELVTLIREAIDKQITERVNEIIQPVIEQTIASRFKEKLDKAVAKCEEQVNAVLIDNSKICHLIIDCIKVFAPAPVKKTLTYNNNAKTLPQHLNFTNLASSTPITFRSMSKNSLRQNLQIKL